MTVEELYVNSYGGDLTDWSKTGNTPYLSDSDTNYISAIPDGYQDGHYLFPSSAGSGVINSVKIRVEEKCSIVSRGYVELHVFDGLTWYHAYFYDFGGDNTSFSWREIEVGAFLNTWAKINACEVYFIRVRVYGTTGSETLRRCTRKVDYTSGGGGGILAQIMAVKQVPKLPLSPLKMMNKFLGVKTIG